jgi:glutathione S-transferase
MITLHQFPSCFDIPNASPFCMKLESYLKAMSLPYATAKGFDPRKSPTGKVPYIELDHDTIADSHFIIRKLESTVDTPMQNGLNSRQQAETVAFMRLLEEHLYWVTVYSRWVDEAGFTLWCNGFQKAMGIPALAFKFIIKGIRKDVTKQLHGHGMGRHTQAEIYQLGCDDIDALADFLAEKPYFYNDRSTLLDHCLYAHICGILSMPWEYPLKTHTLKKQSLVDHYHRMMQQFFPEFVKEDIAHG